MSILPPEVRAGYVYDRVLRAIGDRPYDDDRLPDGIPAKGKVIFRPKNAVKQLVSEGRGVTVTREPVTCTIHQGAEERNDPDPEKGGLLIDEAGAVGGVWLVIGEWTAEYHMEDRYSNIPNEEIIVTEEHTEDNPLDVALASELTPTPTQKFVVNEQVYVDTLAARDEVQDNLHNMVISGEVVGDDLQLSRHGGDTIVAGNVRGPRGPQGVQGPMGTLELIGGDNPAITVDTTVGTRVFVGDTMIYGDTGWRDISHLATQEMSAVDVRVRRIGSTVAVVANQFTFATGVEVSAGTAFLSIPDGFKSSSGFRQSGAYEIGAIYSHFQTKELMARDLQSGRSRFYVTYLTDDSWPSNLPGAPA